MFCKHNKSLVLASLTILASITVYNIYGASNVFAATASLSTTGTVNIDVSAAGNSANIGTDTLTVNTTCSTGYTVTIQSSINDATLYKDGDSTSTSKIAPSTGTISAPASILGNNLGTWGYSMTSSTITGTFTGLNSTPAIIKQSTTASATGGDQFPVYYGVSVTPTLEPGAYTMANDPNNGNNLATIVYQLTMPVSCQTYTIKYNGNNNDAGTTMSVVNDNLSLNDTTTLMPSNFKRAGYGFAGWNTKADGTGTDFGPMEDVTLSTSDTKGNALLQAADPNTKEITLYAKWIQSQGNIQNWQGCSSMTNGQVTALTDTRDNNVYAIAKLADGNCWMIENLRLGGSSAMNLTPTNTAITSNVTLPASTNTFVANNYTTIEMSAKNTLEAPTDMTATNAEVYSYGNYYSWAAAIGSTTAYSSGSATTSICPNGWQLPLGNTTSGKSFGALDVAMGGAGAYQSAAEASNRWRKYPNNYIYSGYLYRSSFYDRGSESRYWSSTVSDSYLSYYLSFFASAVNPGRGNTNKYNGFSVRCVADEPDLTSISTMQEMTPDICAATPEGTEKQLTDTRDGKSYWVAKLADGGCWMTQNLDHDIVTTAGYYTPDNTDIPANWTPDKSTYVTGTTTWDRTATGNNIQQSYDPGNKIWDGTLDSSYNTNLSNMTQGTNEHYHIGNYYNWSAAVAMNDTSSYTTDNTDVNQSICPKGWTLPKGGNITTAGSFQNLVNQYNWASNSMTNPNIWQAPLYFPLSGNWYGSSGRVASYGDFWSSVVRSSDRAYGLYENYGGGVSPVSSSDRYVGYSVRCVSREAGSTPGITLGTIETMQQMNSDICAATPEGTEKQLTDSRDSKSYWVTKLADGKCWMTQNLDHDIDSAKTYTPADTDIPANWTPDKSTYATGTTTWDNSNTSFNIQQSYDPGDKIWDGTLDNNYSTNLNNMTQGTNEHYHLGNYYNWSAAVAMNDTSSYTTQNTDVNQSICPKGWTLPKGGNIITAGSFQYLVKQYNWVSGLMTNPSIWQAPLYFPLSGDWRGGSYGVASDGVFWSSVVFQSNLSYGLYGNSYGDVFPVDGPVRSYGRSVRCVSR